MAHRRQLLNSGYLPRSRCHQQSSSSHEVMNLVTCTSMTSCFSLRSISPVWKRFRMPEHAKCICNSTKPASTATASFTAEFWGSALGGTRGVLGFRDGAPGLSHFCDVERSLSRPKPSRTATAFRGVELRAQLQTRSMILVSLHQDFP